MFVVVFYFSVFGDCLKRKLTLQSDPILNPPCVIRYSYLLVYRDSEFNKRLPTENLNRSCKQNSNPQPFFPVQPATPLERNSSTSSLTLPTPNAIWDREARLGVGWGGEYINNKMNNNFSTEKDLSLGIILFSVPVL